MDGAALGDAGGFHDGFAERWMGMDRLDDFVFGGFKRFGHDQFGEEIGDVFADHVDAEEFAVLGVEDQFDESVGFAHGQGPAAGAEGEFADLHFLAGVRGPFFR